MTVLDLRYADLGSASAPVEIVERRREKDEGVLSSSTSGLSSLSLATDSFAAGLQRRGPYLLDRFGRESAPQLQNSMATLRCMSRFRPAASRLQLQQVERLGELVVQLRLRRQQAPGAAFVNVAAGASSSSSSTAAVSSAPATTTVGVMPASSITLPSGVSYFATVRTSAAPSEARSSSVALPRQRSFRPPGRRDGSRNGCSHDLRRAGRAAVHQHCQRSGGVDGLAWVSGKALLGELLSLRAS